MPPNINISPVDFKPHEIESFMPMMAYTGRIPMNMSLVAMTTMEAREGE
jgi:hypothetical protein